MTREKHTLGRVDIVSTREREDVIPVHICKSAAALVRLYDNPLTPQEIGYSAIRDIKTLAAAMITIIESLEPASAPHRSRARLLDRARDDVERAVICAVWAIIDKIPDNVSVSIATSGPTRDKDGREIVRQKDLATHQEFASYRDRDPAK